MTQSPQDHVNSGSLTGIFTELQGVHSQALLRQALYKLFATLFLYPDEELILSLKSYVEELSNNSSAWRKYIFAEKLSQLIDQILDIHPRDSRSIIDEYNRLFFIKPLVPPYETNYLAKSGQSQPLIAAELSGIYSRAGLEVSPDSNEFPDHIAIELEFMSFLCSHETEAIREEDSEKLSSAQKGQIDFMSQHLALWYPEFTKRLFEETNPELIYRSLAVCAFAFIRNDLSILGIKLGED
jgi:DMSO reductase family type II enzyme chaperone